MPTQIAYSATRLSYDAEIRRLFFQYRDTDTGEVQREIPSRDALRVYEQREQRREEARAAAAAEKASESNAGNRLEPRVIDGAAINVQRPAAPANAESAVSGETESRRGATTDQIV